MLGKPDLVEDDTSAGTEYQACASYLLYAEDFVVVSLVDVF